MNARKFFGYIRVSTAKQGEHGVSLQEQKDAIDRYAQRYGLEIVTWYEERETAAKRGRPVFAQMLKGLRSGKATGVVIHKIDRSARNLKDWADLGELIDQGIEVHFANESLDLHSRGGRLSADIQAVVAADYIRNLREETRKGFYGRIKQGFFPLPAPLGYVDKGKGKPKELDPAKSPLVKKAFELYGSARYSIDTLLEELSRLGLRNRNGSKLSRNGLSTILNNPFYIGLIRLRRTGETFPGNHPPLIKKSLFDRVQQVLSGKYNTVAQRHEFLFRRMFTCAYCGYSLIGETQKGHIYYRCQTKNCPTTCVREDTVENEILRLFSSLQFSDKEKDYFQSKVDKLNKEWVADRVELTKAMQLKLSQVKDRLNRLTDAYIDQVIEKELFEQRKAALLMEQAEIQEKFVHLSGTSQCISDRVSEFLELAGSTYLQYKFALQEEKRDLLRIATSNRLVDGKKVDITLAFPFSEVSKRFKNTNGAPHRDIPRTWDRLLAQFSEFFTVNPGFSNPGGDQI